jgi:hypothetical protein
MQPSKVAFKVVRRQVVVVALGGHLLPLYPLQKVPRGGGGELNGQNGHFLGQPCAAVREAGRHQCR